MGSTTKNGSGELPVILERVRWAAAIKPLLALAEEASILVCGRGAERVQRALAAMGYRNVSAVTSGNVRFDDAAFDAVVSSEATDVAAMARVVKPGGIVSITSGSYMWRWLAKLGVEALQPATKPSDVVDMAKAAGLAVAGYGGLANVPAQQWYLGRTLLQWLNPLRWVRQQQEAYPAYEHLDEVQAIVSAVDEFELTAREDWWGATFAYESYYWFCKSGETATAAGPAGVQETREYRAAA